MRTRSNKYYARTSRFNTSLRNNLRKDIERRAPNVIYNGGYEEYEDSHDYIRIKAVLTR